jgi:hypothetical protein
MIAAAASLHGILLTCTNNPTVTNYCCRSGECIRGLLCHTCNIALGHIEHRYAMARVYLDSPPVLLLATA